MIALAVVVCATPNPAQYRALNAAAHRGDTHITAADCDAYTLHTLAGAGLGVLEYDRPDEPSTRLRISQAAWLIWSAETDRLNAGGEQREPAHWNVPTCVCGACIAGDVCPTCVHVREEVTR